MLRLVPAPTFKALVRITVPGADAPAVVPMEFRHKGRQALADWIAASKDKLMPEALDDVIVGWETITDERGENVTYSRDALTVLLAQYGPSGTEILEAYLNQLRESRAKN